MMATLNVYSLWLLLINAIIIRSYMSSFNFAISRLDHRNIPFYCMKVFFYQSFLTASSHKLHSTSSDTNSVHLALTHRLDKDPERPDDADNQSSKDIFEVFEAYDSNSNVSVATLVDDWYLNIFATQIHGLSHITTRKWKANLKDSQDKERLLSLWKSGRLLSRSETFPTDRRSHTRSFLANVQDNVKRLKLLLKDMENQSEIISFLHHSNLDIYSYQPNLTYNDAIHRLKGFAIWFRQEFPYYNDRCDACDNAVDNSYAGVMAPTAADLCYQARVVETSVCSRCSAMTRFPRYNNVEKVLVTRRGRCGEYSALIIRLLHSLGYHTRWVTDIADHLWAEVWIDNKWIHFDPCEAAIAEPYIYQGWGKIQTYIIAYDMQHRTASDVTHIYTSNLDAVMHRRQADGINDIYIAYILQQASSNLSALHTI